VTSPLRERATDHLGVVHEITNTTWSLIETRCGVRSRWRDRVVGLFSNNVMTWDGFDPTPDVTCMACMVKGARR
jgi:hypothetical protein